MGKPQSMKAGFGRIDITPRVGVELCGFGAFRCRHSIGIRDRLWARAMAIEQGGATVVIISCDLIGITRDITRKVRARLTETAGLAGESVMICCSHTHSGPNTGPYIGWGAPDEPYRETLHNRIAGAATAALADLRAAELRHAEVPCPGIGLNREYDRDQPPLDEVLRHDWQPAKPELTDTTCHVLAIHAPDGQLRGFASYFGCHPVVCCSATRFIHGDYPGVATGQVERDYDGVTGLFFQGAQGDVNSCVVHKPEQESLLALDIVAGRYARALRNGLAEAQPVTVDRVAAISETMVFSRKSWDLKKLRGLLEESEARLNHPQASDVAVLDDTWNIRMETVYVLALRDLVARAERGDTLEPATEVHGIRIGPIALLGSPFETFQAIKNDVRAASQARWPLVMSFVDDSVGYAPDRTAASRGGYAQDMVPLICGEIPYADVHTELVAALLRIDKRLARNDGSEDDTRSC